MNVIIIQKNTGLKMLQFLQQFFVCVSTYTVVLSKLLVFSFANITGCCNTLLVE